MATVTANPYATVQSGSMEGFTSIGKVFYGETVTLLWSEGSYYYIEYTVDSTGKKKRGYILMRAVNGSTSTVGNITRGTRYVHKKATVYFGPGSSYAPTDYTLDVGRTVTYLGYKVNNYAYVEYQNTSNSVGAYERGYVYANNLGTGKVKNYT